MSDYYVGHRCNLMCAEKEIMLELRKAAIHGTLMAATHQAVVNGLMSLHRHLNRRRGRHERLSDQADGELSDE